MFTPTLATRSPMLADPRHLGVMVAMFICSVVIVGGAVLDPPGGWVVGLVGLPATLALSWRFGPELATATGRGTVKAGVRFGAKVILVTDALVIGVAAVPTAISGISWVFTDHHPFEWPVYLVAGFFGLLGLAVLFFLAGAAFVGIPVSFVVLPAALLWAYLLRALLRWSGAVVAAEQALR